MLAAILAAVVAAIGVAASASSANKQAQANKDLAAFQADANQKYLNQQNEYNSPKNQMARFQSAGLNPNLIYGQGSPGNQTSPLSYPDIKPANFQARKDPSEVLAAVNQQRITDAQVNATNATTLQKTAMTEVNRLQARVMERNPALNDGGFAAMIDNLKASAQLKQEQVKGQKIQNFTNDAAAGWRVDKVYKEVQLLEQRFQLGSKDAAIKAEVLKSKEFQNAILEVQKRFMTDGDITPQHIVQFIQLLLMKAL